MPRLKDGNEENAEAHHPSETDGRWDEERKGTECIIPLARNVAQAAKAARNIAGGLQQLAGHDWTAGWKASKAAYLVPGLI